MKGPRSLVSLLTILSLVRDVSSLVRGRGLEDEVGDISLPPSLPENATLPNVSDMVFNSTADPVLPLPHEEVDTVILGGKGGKGSKKSSKKDSTRSSKKGSKSSKKGKGSTYSPVTPPPGKGGSSKSGKGTIAPSSSGSSKGQPRPPSPIAAPTRVPAPTLTNPDEQSVELPKYAIAYTVVNDAMPMSRDYRELGIATDEFFAGYMFGRYQNSATADLVRFETNLVTSKFVFGEPVLVEYNSIAYFTEDSILPKPQVLEEVLAEALSPPTAYLNKLSTDLSPGNAFLNVNSVEFKEPDTRVVSSPSSSDSLDPAVAGITAAAAGLALLLAGAVLYRRQQDGEGEEDYYNQKSLDNKAPYGDVTVAGETYSGETCDGTISVSPSAGLSGSVSRDEEQGMISEESGESDNEDDEALSENEEAENQPLTSKYQDKSERGDEIDYEDSGLSEVIPHYDEELNRDAESTQSDFTDERYQSEMKSLEGFDALYHEGLTEDLPSSQRMDEMSFDEDDDCDKNRPLTVDEIDAMLSINM